MNDAPLSAGGFRVGSVMSRGFSIYFGNFLPFTLLSGVVFSPLIVYTALIEFSPETSQGFGVIGNWLAVVTVSTVPLGMLLNAAIVYGAFQQLRGQRASAVQCLAYGIGRILPVIGVALLAGLCMLLGFALLVIPGIIVMVKLWVAIPVAVVERPGIVASLKRSMELTSGHGWSIFAILFLMNVIERILTFMVEAAVLQSPTLYFTMTLVVAAFLAALNAVITAVGYHDLRVQKEGVDTNQIAAVFD